MRAPSARHGTRTPRCSFPGRYNPIEHVTSRVKSPTSILGKVVRRGLDLSFDTFREHITDIAGVRITCSSIADTYRVLKILTAQADVRVLAVKDYIAAPEANGYESLHAIVEIPVFLSDGPVPVTVEVQIRTIAMDFWASLEHEIYYEYDGAVPDHLAESLAQAAAVAEQVDRRMEELHTEVRSLAPDVGEAAPGLGIDDRVLRQLLAMSAGTSP